MSHSGRDVNPLNMDSGTERFDQLAETWDADSSRAALAKAVADGRYPSPPARDLNLLTEGKPTGATAAFIRWIVADGQKFVEPEGFIRLTAPKLAAAKAKLK